jgi:hypothetical protein
MLEVVGELLLTAFGEAAGENSTQQIGLASAAPTMGDPNIYSKQRTIDAAVRIGRKLKYI